MYILTILLIFSILLPSLVRGSAGHNLDDLDVSITLSDILSIISSSDTTADTSISTDSSSSSTTTFTSTTTTTGCSGMDIVEGRMSEFRVDVRNLQFDVHHLIFDVSRLRSQILAMNNLVASHIVSTLTIMMTPTMSSLEIIES